MSNATQAGQGIKEQDASDIFNEAITLLWQDGNPLPFTRFLAGAYGMMQSHMQPAHIERLREVLHDARVAEARQGIAESGRQLSAAAIPHKLA